MRFNLIPLGLVLLSAGCAPQDSGSSGFASAADDEVGIEAGDAEQPSDEAQPEDGGDADTDPLVPVDDEGSEFDWALPPEAPGVGSRLRGTWTCGFFALPVEREFTFDGEAWQETTADSDAARSMLPGTAACLSEGSPKVLDWYVDMDDMPFIYFGGGLNHDLRPTAVRNLWDGRVYPRGTPTEACVEALAAHGLTLPVVMSYRVTALELVAD
jgi:hypothetical protein